MSWVTIVHLFNWGGGGGGGNWGRIFVYNFSQMSGSACNVRRFASYRVVSLHTLYPLPIYVRQGAHESTPLSRDLSPLSKRATNWTSLQSFPRRPPRGARVVLPRCHELRHESDTLCMCIAILYFDFVLCFDKAIVLRVYPCRCNVTRTRGDVKTCCLISVDVCIDGRMTKSRRIESFRSFRFDLVERM